MKKINLVILFSLILSSAFSIEKTAIKKGTFGGLKRIYFDVANGFLEQMPGKPGVLGGTVEANDVSIDFGAERFEIENPGQQVIDAHLEWNETNYRLSVKKDGLMFSTPLVEGLGLSDVQNIRLQTAIVELVPKGITMKGNQLSFQHKELLATLTSANIFCPTYGVFTTEIDQACLKDSTATIGVISFDQKALDADFIDARSFIKENTFKLTAHKARFNDEEETTEVDTFSLQCLRLRPEPIGKAPLQVDPYSLLQGCLKSGRVGISSMDTKDRLKEVVAEIWPEMLKKAPELLSQKDLIDIDNIHDIDLRFDNGRLNLEARVKLLFRVKVKLKGEVFLDTEKSELQFRINRATIWGIPTGKLAYRLIEKFGRGDFIEIRGDLIIFKI